MSERFEWSINQMNIQPTDRILEIGCGHGIAVDLICQTLSTGQITAIDRSAKMVDIAKRRNQVHIDAGHVQFHTIALEAMDFGEGHFDKIFAINVNLFWQKPIVEIPIIHRALRDDGELYLFYQPPHADKATPILTKVQEHLVANKFAIREVVKNHQHQTLIAMIASK
ncbi:MAG: class I SAM-dependent methyltransferase [Chloroflexota bacterium]